MGTVCKVFTAYSQKAAKELTKRPRHHLLGNVSDQNQTNSWKSENPKYNITNHTVNGKNKRHCIIDTVK